MGFINSPKQYPKTIVNSHPRDEDGIQIKERKLQDSIATLKIDYPKLSINVWNKAFFKNYFEESNIDLAAKLAMLNAGKKSKLSTTRFIATDEVYFKAAMIFFSKCMNDPELVKKYFSKMQMLK